MAPTQYGNKISPVGIYDEGHYTYVPVIIIGAGESGIAMGAQLKQQLGFDQFRILERQSGIGGTWWINRYPGVACDIPSVVYSFSFAQNPDWSSLFPSGPEFCRYLHGVVTKYGIADKVQLNTNVEHCKWLEDEQVWEVEVRHMAPGTGDLAVKDRTAKIEREGEGAVFVGRETLRAKVVCSAVGGLVEPNAVPKNIPGWSDFQGDVFHSARWRYDVDLKDKNVVVVGTGCSAAQFVPHLTKTYGARSVTQLMRSPPWIVPRAKVPEGYMEKWAPLLNRHVPGYQRLFRSIVFLVLEHHFALFGNDERSQKFRAKYEEYLLEHMRSTVPAKYHKMLTPDYGVGCKRRIFDATWLPALNDERIELTTKPLTRVNAASVTIGPGLGYGADAKAEAGPEDVPADVIILGNGFETQKFLHPLTVLGRGGADLVATMDARGGPQAYLGTAMDGFPNFFILFGPNTGTGHHSVILTSENQISYSLQFISRILAGDVRTVEVKRAAEVAWTQQVQSRLRQMVWGAGGCQNWYVHDGWNGHMAPYSQMWYTFWLFRYVKWGDWNVRRTAKGEVKRVVGAVARVLLLGALALGWWRAREAGEGVLEYFKGEAMRFALIARMGVRQRFGV